MERVEQEGERGDAGTDVDADAGTGGGVGWDGDEEGGSECRRTRGVTVLTTGLLERGAKGLAVTERRGRGGVRLRAGCDDDEDDAAGR